MGNRADLSRDHGAMATGNDVDGGEERRIGGGHDVGKKNRRFVVVVCVTICFH